MASPLKIRSYAPWIPGSRQVTVGRKTIVTLYCIAGGEYRRLWYFKPHIVYDVVRLPTSLVLAEGQRRMHGIDGDVIRAAVDGEFLGGVDWWDRLEAVASGLVGHVHIAVAILAGPYQVTGVR